MNDFLLTPMSQEKADLLLKACKEWNIIMFRASRLRENVHSSSEAGRQIKWRQARHAATKTRHAIHFRLAHDAATKGLTGRYVYTPTRAFFVPPDLMTLDGKHMWLRLFPLLELGFECDDAGPPPYIMKVYLGDGGWRANYEHPSA